MREKEKKEKRKKGVRIDWLLSL